jgi:hypothetical protein
MPSGAVDEPPPARHDGRPPRATGSETMWALHQAKDLMDEFITLAAHERHNPMAALKARVQRLGRLRTECGVPGTEGWYADGWCSGVAKEAREMRAHLPPVEQKVWDEWKKRTGGDGRFHDPCLVLPNHMLNSDSFTLGFWTLLQSGFLVGSEPVPSRPLTLARLRGSRFRALP